MTRLGVLACGDHFGTNMNKLDPVRPASVCAESCRGQHLRCPMQPQCCALQLFAQTEADLMRSLTYDARLDTFYNAHAGA